MIKHLALSLSLLVLISLGTVGCARHQSAAPSKPLVLAVQTETGDSKPSIAPDQTTTPSLRKVQITADKNLLLSTEFLYGADLQYSSLYDKDMDLYNQSMAIGHIPARFRIVGDELLLIADNRRLFPSDVNHPDQVISRYKILAETDTTLTLSSANSSVFLGQIFEGTHTSTAGGITNPAGKPPRDLWIRSFEFVAQGNYLLQETSIVAHDGSVAEFMESVFPREAIAPGKDFKKFELDPEDPTNAGPNAESMRFRFLPGEKIHDGEQILAFAQHFDISPNAEGKPGTIDWYTTRNISDEDLQSVKLAIEGWNRYFRAMKGIERDVIRVPGRLPEGVKLGDPRFNVINWDNRLIAGAAYESQATDPHTGKQSHSLIYMPAAWLKIGHDYWRNGQFSDATIESVGKKQLAKRAGAVRAARLACLRDMREASGLLMSGRLIDKEIEEFGIELLKGTLFHEVGHALGLAHNFKGSLSFDRSQKPSKFSTSIMDYNAYEVEKGAFSGVDSADGPLLEYDRQALSALYNNSNDISDSDPEVPVCNDDEADNEGGGVDPLCNRYDVEKDPTLSITTAFDRIMLAKKPGDVTLTEALGNVLEGVIAESKVSEIKSRGEFMETAERLAASLVGSLRFYVHSGKASLARVIRTNSKSLLVFDKGVFPTGSADDYDERAMRERTFSGIQKALALMELPKTVESAWKKAQNEALERLQNTPYVQSLPFDRQARLIILLNDILEESYSVFQKDMNRGLPRMRAHVIASLARHEDVPLFFGTLKGATPKDKPVSLDFEVAVVTTLRDVVLNAKRSKLERVLGATALATYRDRISTANQALKRVAEAVTYERGNSKDNEGRETAIMILDALKGDTDKQGS